MNDTIQSKSGSKRALTILLACLAVISLGLVACDSGSEESGEKESAEKSDKADKDWLKEASAETRKPVTVELDDGLKVTVDLPESYQHIDRGNKDRWDYQKGETSDAGVPSLTVTDVRGTSARAAAAKDLEGAQKADAEVLQNEAEKGAQVLSFLDKAAASEKLSVAVHVYRLVDGKVVECAGDQLVTEDEAQKYVDFIKSVCFTLRPEGAETAATEGPLSLAALEAAEEMTAHNLEHKGSAFTVSVPASYESGKTNAMKLGVWTSPTHERALPVTVRRSLTTKPELGADPMIEQRKADEELLREDLDDGVLVALKSNDLVSVVRYLKAGDTWFECDTSMIADNDGDAQDVIEFGKKTCGTLAVANAEPTN